MFLATLDRTSDGSFITKDPLGFGGGSTNLYSYTLNDPINLRDPSGLVATSVTGTYPSGGLNGYVDINVTLAPALGGPGVTFGVQISGNTAYPYLGGGVYTGPGASLTISPDQSPSCGLNVSGQGRLFGGAVSGGYSTTTGAGSWDMDSELPVAASQEPMCSLESTYNE